MLHIRKVFMLNYQSFMGNHKTKKGNRVRWYYDKPPALIPRLRLNLKLVLNLYSILMSNESHV